MIKSLFLLPNKLTGNSHSAVIAARKLNDKAVAIQDENKAEARRLLHRALRLLQSCPGEGNPRTSDVESRANRTSKKERTTTRTSACEFVQEEEGTCSTLEESSSSSSTGSLVEPQSRDVFIVGATKAENEYEEGMDPFPAYLRLEKDDCNTRVLSTILFNLGRLAQAERNYGLTMEFYQRARHALVNDGSDENDDETSPPSHLKLAIWTSLGHLYYMEREDFTEAQHFYTTALRMAMQLYGSKSLESAACWNALGVLYYAMSVAARRLDESLEAFQRALELRQQLLGEDHPDTATTWNNLGRLSYLQGNYEDGLTAYQNSLRIRQLHCEEEEGESSDRRVKLVDVAATAFNMGQVLHQLQDFAGALQHYRRFLQLAKLQFGVYHRDVCIVMTCIGQVLHSTKEYSRALKTYFKALGISLQVFGDVHTEIALIYNKMGNLFYELGDFDEALNVYHKGRNIELQLFQEGSVNIHVTYSNIVEIHRQRSEFDHALNHAQELLKLQQEESVMDQAQIANTLSTIASIHHQMGQYDRAFEVNQECLGIRRELYCDGIHESIASDLFQTALNLVKLGRCSMALEAMLEAYRIQRSFGKENKELASASYNVALIYHRQGSHELALLYYLETARIEQGFLGDEHRDLSITLYNLGQVYYQRGEMEIALQYFHRALDIEQTCFGKKHPTCARTWKEIGHIQLEMGNIDGLMEAFSRALRIHREGVIDEDSQLIYGIALWRFEVVQPVAAAAA